MYVQIIFFCLSISIIIVLSIIAVAVSDIVRASLTNAQELLKQEEMFNSGTEHIEDVRYDRSGATDVDGGLEEK